ncbi:hypothetical protein HU200_050978 [Digitaria exilis]|uniref:Uncharacterized protein n=1 Tax=Digitaria exilis TaxID=1010633 RepID=A0A835EAH3_9POAL|nr:hypothetical protein HU200_050978 [Digitaria exilis]
MHYACQSIRVEQHRSFRLQWSVLDGTKSADAQDLVSSNVSSSLVPNVTLVAFFFRGLGVCVHRRGGGRAGLHVHHVLGEEGTQHRFEDKAYDQCSRSYHEAKAAMDRTWRRLARVRTRLPERCGLDLGAEYRVALRSLRACRDDHLAKMPDSQLLGMAKADYDRTQVAYRLGILIGIKIGV